MLRNIQTQLSINLSLIILIGFVLSTPGQTVTIGSSSVLYSGTRKNGSKPPLYKKISVFESPFSPPHDGTLNSDWQMILDGIPCPLRKNQNTFTFFLFQGYGLDKYEGSLNDPLKTRKWGVYNQNIAKVGWCRVPHDPLNEEWYPTTTLINLWPSYETNQDRLYRGAPPEETVAWEKAIGNVAIYKVTPEDAAAVPSVHAGDLIGITHVEISAIGQRSPLYNYRYALGISYAKAIDDGKKWTYFGEIISQAASQYDDVFMPVNNGGGPGYCIHNISGGPLMRVGDYFYVYFDEFADTLHTPPMHEHVVPCVAVARARVTEVLATLGSGAVGNIPSDQWRKYADDAWIENAMTGRGGNVIPLPESEWPLNYFNASLDGQNSWPAASFSTHTCAAVCTAVNPPLYLMTLKAQTAQYSMHTLTENLILYRSNDGLSWAPAGNVYSQSFPYNPGEAYEGPLVQYCCFVAGDATASDDFHKVGNEFYIMYPVIRDCTPPFTAEDPFDADLMLAKITVRQ